jgi:Putative zinc binding domain
MLTTESRQLRGAAACRFWAEVLSDTVVDLGMSPLCESYLQPDQLNAMEAFYPLDVYVCRRCWLVQLEQHVSAEHISRSTRTSRPSPQLGRARP